MNRTSVIRFLLDIRNNSSSSIKVVLPTSMMRTALLIFGNTKHNDIALLFTDERLTIEADGWDLISRWTGGDRSSGECETGGFTEEIGAETKGESGETWSELSSDLREDSSDLRVETLNFRSTISFAWEVIWEVKRTSPFSDVSLISPSQIQHRASRAVYFASSVLILPPL